MVEKIGLSDTNLSTDGKLDEELEIADARLNNDQDNQNQRATGIAQKNIFTETPRPKDDDNQSATENLQDYSSEVQVQKADADHQFILAR